MTRPPPRPLPAPLFRQHFVHRWPSISASAPSLLLDFRGGIATCENVMIYQHGVSRGRPVRPVARQLEPKPCPPTPSTDRYAGAFRTGEIPPVIPGAPFARRRRGASRQTPSASPCRGPHKEPQGCRAQASVLQSKFQCRYRTMQVPHSTRTPLDDIAIFSGSRVPLDWKRIRLPRYSPPR